MRIVLANLLLICSLNLLAQNDTTIVVADYNEDGFPDSLLSYYSGGSGFGGRFVEVIDGKSGEKIAFDNFGSFGNLLRIVPFSEEIYDNYYPFLEPVLEQLTAGSGLSSADPSMSWLGNASQFLMQPEQSADNHPFFDHYLGHYELWETGELIRPQISASIEIHPELGKLMYHFAMDSSQLQAETFSYFLIYLGHNHFGPHQEDFLPVAANDQYRLLSTAHGLIAQRLNGDYKWLFISQPGITRAPMKLRWPSISKVQLEGEYALLLQEMLVSQAANLWVIHIPSGQVGKLADQYFGMRYNEQTMEMYRPDYRTAAGQLIIQNGEEELQILLDDLFD